LTKLCRLKLGGPVIMPHRVYFYYLYSCVLTPYNKDVTMMMTQHHMRDLPAEHDSRNNCSHII